MDAVEKPIGILPVFIMAAVMIALSMQVVSAIANADASRKMLYLSSRKDLVSECNSWLEGSALNSAYENSLGNAVDRIRKDDFGTLCPKKSDVSRSSDLFHCRVMCVLVSKAESNCNKNPLYYDFVGVPGGVFGDDEGYVASTVGTYANSGYDKSVLQSHCLGRMLQLIANLPTSGDTSTESLLDCFVDPSKSGVSICKNWKGKQG